MTTPYQTLALPVDSIQSHPENDFTMDESEMQELVASIRSEGLGQLPLVRKLPDGTYQMIAGHRRLEAYRRLAREDAAFRTIPVTLVDNLDDARARVLLNVTNLVTRRLSQEERGARYAAIGREVPALREADPSLKGVRTNDIIARIVTEETGQSVSPATVKRAIAAEKRLRETREQAELLTGDLNENWQVEAQAGVVDPLTLRAISQLPNQKQLDLFVEYQRQEMTFGQLKAHLKASRPKTTADASRALQAAIRSVEEARRMDREGVPLSQGLIRKLKSLVDQL